MRLLYLVRHGHHVKSGVEEPDGNEDGVLSDDGHEQARLLGGRLRSAPGGARFAEVRHSTLRRGAGTAAALGLGAPLIGDDELRECVPHRPPDAELGAAHRAWFAEWPAAILEHGARQAAALVARYGAFDVLGDRPVLLVTHGNVIAWLVCSALGTPPARWLGMPHFNAALTVLGHREGRPPALLAYNDAGHLPPRLRGTDHSPEFRI